MISQREVKRQYAKLMFDVENDPYYKGDVTKRVNTYSCTRCKHETQTREIDAGCTAMSIQCKCGGIARSHFYVEISPDKEPEKEWYRPSLEETIKLRNKPHILEHVLKGGLLIRDAK